ncbi:MAG: ATP-binding protein [Actinomycetota bacterium]
MRVAFVGKGGSGKTTLAAAFAEYEAMQGRRVLALDADINQHLAGALGFEGTLRSLGLEMDLVKAHLRGTNARFTAEEMRKTTPPGGGSTFVTLADDDWFIDTYTQPTRAVRVAGAGEIPEGNVGVRCYHGLNGVVELVLGHMLDTPDETVVVDMTAGADAFSSSLFAKVDAMVLVVEPTLKSLSVRDQFAEHVEQHDLRLLVVANKVQDDDDRAFIEDRVGELAAVVGQSPVVRRRERGDTDVGLEDDEDLLVELGKLAAATAKIPRDWALLERRSHALHSKNADDWMGAGAIRQIDTDFSLKEYATARGY